MRKLFAALAVVFAFAFALGAFAAGDPTLPNPNCTYFCTCSGAPMQCCTSSSGKTVCGPTQVIQCPQVYNC